ncbi:MAG: YfhO family protein [Acidobacteria bacterium]|nr:YfhO family protein [Acidobacteriota bacterium]
MSVWLARRYAGHVSRWAALLLVLLPLVFTGRAMLSGGVYGPADLYPPFVPWRSSAGALTPPPANPILSDLAFANLPWRAAVREAFAAGRFPFWNRFVLAGNPLLATAQAGIFHPATWAGIFLPLPLSWTFSCAFTLFLGLLSGYLYFRDLELSPAAALAGATAWGFSTYLVFWNGWSVGPSTATFPLLLLGLRRIAGGGARGIALTVAALLLSLAGGHPETFFHTSVVGAAVFAADLVGRARRGGAGRGRRALLRGGAAAALAFLLSGPQLFPLLEAIPHSAEYRERRARLETGVERQSVPPGAAAGRLVPALLPFAHGIYGKSPVQQRGDGSGMPLPYAGAVLFPLAALGAARRREGRALFASCLAAGLLLGVSAPGLIDLLARLPGFSLALNYRLVFLAAFGLAGLAALGLDALRAADSARLAAAAGGVLVLLIGARVAAAGLLRERDLPEAFVGAQFLFEIVPVAVLAAAAFAWRRRGARVAAAALALLVIQRGLEMGGTYPTVAAEALAPREALPDGLVASGARVGATGSDLRPNGSALFGLEDVRGYESIVLDRFADTFPLWCVPQPASFNRIDDPGRPFLSFLGMRFAIAAPDAPVPPGFRVRARTGAAAVFENPRALPRAFAPARVISAPDTASILRAMASAQDFSQAAWVRGASGEERNPATRISVRESGPDFELVTVSPAPFLAATSLPDWPGWRAVEEGTRLPIQTVNHAFVGIRIPGGVRRIRLSYRPPGFLPGVAACAAGLLAIAAGPWWRRRRTRGRG